MNKNFLEHNIKGLLSNDWGIECSAPFKHVFRFGNQFFQLLPRRWNGGPRVNEVEPILVMFEDRKEKDQVARMTVLTVNLPRCGPS